MALKAELAAYEGKQHAPVPVSLPVFNLKNGNIEQEAREDEQHRNTIRTIKVGREAWATLSKANNFESWKRIGAALAVGKNHALRVTQSNAPWGSAYSHEFGHWMKEHGFGAMRPSDRSVAIELVENLSAIEAWRATLTDKQRRKRIHPLSNVAAWKKTIAQGKSVNTYRAANIAWTRFKSLMEKLPPDQAVPLWRNVYEQAAGVIVSA